MAGGQRHFAEEVSSSVGEKKNEQDELLVGEGPGYVRCELAPKIKKTLRAKIDGQTPVGKKIIAQVEQVIDEICQVFEKLFQQLGEQTSSLFKELDQLVFLILRNIEEAQRDEKKQIDFRVPDIRLHLLPVQHRFGRITIEPFITYSSRLNLPENLMPVGVCCDGEFCFVSDWKNHAIVKFRHSTGEYLCSFCQKGSLQSELDSPVGISVDKSYLYAADCHNHRIQVFCKQSGKFIRQIGSRGTSNGQFVFPSFIQVTDEEVFVADSGNHRIQVFDKQGAFRRTWGKKGTGNGEFQYVGGISVINNIVFALDLINSRVQVFDLYGNFLRKFGSPGDEVGNFRFCDAQYPAIFAGIAVSTDYIYVADTGVQRIQVFEHDGKYKDSIVQDFPSLRGMCLGNNALHVAEYVGQKVYLFE